MFRFITVLTVLLLCIACRLEKRKPMFPLDDTDSLADTDTTKITKQEPPPAKSGTALYMDSLGLVNVHNADSTIIIHLIYATPDNFTGELLYEDLREAYLHPDAIQALAESHKYLKELYPTYRFIIYDAARPMSVQQKMWDTVKGTPQYMYVANPARGGGLHNYGLAVDISIADSCGRVLPMGTEVDHMGIKSHITDEAALVANGSISDEARNNRTLLRQVMKKGGFRSISSEWWHFNLCSRSEAMQKYQLIK